MGFVCQGIEMILADYSTAAWLYFLLSSDCFLYWKVVSSGEERNIMNLKEARQKGKSTIGLMTRGRKPKILDVDMFDM